MLLRLILSAFSLVKFYLCHFRWIKQPIGLNRAESSHFSDLILFVLFSTSQLCTELICSFLVRHIKSQKNTSKCMVVTKQKLRTWFCWLFPGGVLRLWRRRLARPYRVFRNHDETTPGGVAVLSGTTQVFQLALFERCTNVTKKRAVTFCCSRMPFCWLGIWQPVVEQVWQLELEALMKAKSKSRQTDSSEVCS